MSKTLPRNGAERTLPHNHDQSAPPLMHPHFISKKIPPTNSEKPSAKPKKHSAFKLGWDIFVALVGGVFTFLAVMAVFAWFVSNPAGWATGLMFATAGIFSLGSLGLTFGKLRASAGHKMSTFYNKLMWIVAGSKASKESQSIGKDLEEIRDVHHQPLDLITMVVLMALSGITAIYRSSMVAYRLLTSSQSKTETQPPSMLMKIGHGIMQFLSSITSGLSTGIGTFLFLMSPVVQLASATIAIAISVTFFAMAFCLNAFQTAHSHDGDEDHPLEKMSQNKIYAYKAILIGSAAITMSMASYASFVGISKLAAGLLAITPIGSMILAAVIVTTLFYKSVTYFKAFYDMYFQTHVQDGVSEKDKKTATAEETARLVEPVSSNTSCKKQASAQSDTGMSAERLPTSERSATTSPCLTMSRAGSRPGSQPSSPPNLSRVLSDTITATPSPSSRNTDETDSSDDALGSPQPGISLVDCTNGEVVASEGSIPPQPPRSCSRQLRRRSFSG